MHLLVVVMNSYEASTEIASDVDLDNDVITTTIVLIPAICSMVVVVVVCVMNGNC